MKNSRKSKLTKSNFIISLGSISNIFGGYFNNNAEQLSIIRDISDIKAIKSDWDAIGNDIREVLTIEREKVKFDADSVCL